MGSGLFMNKREGRERLGETRAVGRHGKEGKRGREGEEYSKEW